MLLSGKSKQMSVRMMENPAVLKQLLNPIRWRILKVLVEEPAYPAEIAKKLKMDEQKVYYHIKQLRKSGVISVARTEEMHGATARYFQVKDSAFAIVLNEEWQGAAQKVAQVPAFLKDFYSPDFDAKIVVGSPDPHGPHQARARDAHFASDLCLYLGSLSNSISPAVALDTEIRQKDIEQNNLILIGGPVVNMITARINDELPLQMKTGDIWSIFSDKTQKSYSENSGLLVKVQSPWNPEKTVLVIAGSSRQGTKAAILAIIQQSEKLIAGSHVVSGLDLDGDGIVDSVEIKE